MRIFVAHAWEDKDEVARPLAEALREEGLDVWYDEFSLKLGDSLSGEIDRGLAECDYGVVILSPSFFSKQWPQRELAGLVARETGGRSPRKIILPVWHDIDSDGVRAHSLTLADRIAVSTSVGIEGVVTEIKRAAYVVTVDPDILSRDRALSAGRPDPREMLSRIPHAGPIQPDGGLEAAGVKAVEDLVEEWERTGGINLLAQVQPMSRERKAQLFNDEKIVFLFPDAGMSKIYMRVIDLSYTDIGKVVATVSDEIDYYRALEFFLREMDLFGDMLLVKTRVSPIINSGDHFWMRVE
jgi:hypothetical protein